MRFEQLEKRALLSACAASSFDTQADESAFVEVGHAHPGGEETQVRLEDHPDLVHLLNNKAKGEEEWFLLLSGLVALMPSETPKTTGNVVKFAGNLIGKRPIHPLKRDAVNYALRNKPLLRERVGMVLPRERKRTKKEWIGLLESVIDSLPDGTAPTVSNIASYSNGILTVQMIRNALMWHDIQSFKQGWMKREYEVPRSRDGWATLLKQAIAELPTGTPPTSNAIETLTFGQIKRTQIASALHRFDMPYREVGLVREAIVAKTREAWADLLRDRVREIPQGASPTPYHVGPYVYERNGAEIIRDTLWYYGIKYAEVDMVPLPLTRNEWLESIRRAKQNLEPDQSPVPRNVAASSRNEFTLQELKQAMRPAGQGGFGITHEDAGLEKEIRVKRPLEERMRLIRSAAQEIFDTTGYLATPQDVSDLLCITQGEEFTASQIASAIREAGIRSYEDLNMITSKHGPHVQVHSRAQSLGVQSEMLDGDENGTGAMLVAARSRFIAPDARLDVEDAIHRTRLRLPDDHGKVVDEVVAKLRMEAELLYDIDALAESLDRTPEQVQSALQALHEVFGEGSWDHTSDPRAADDIEAATTVGSSNGLAEEEDDVSENRPHRDDASGCFSNSEDGVSAAQLLQRILSS